LTVLEPRPRRARRSQALAPRCAMRCRPAAPWLPGRCHDI